MAGATEKPPVWFWVAAVVLTLWAAMGVMAFYMQVTMSPEAAAQLSEYDRNLIAGLPNWVNWAYGVATWAGLLGSLSLLLRRAWAVPLYVASLAAVVVQFGYILGMTDIIAAKGFMGAAAFPIFIAVMAVVELLFARSAVRNNWIS